jgi:predicted LPLAT superfamily acyltransferase
MLLSIRSASVLARGESSQARGERWHGRTLGGALLFRVCAFLLPFVGVPGTWVGSYVISAGFLACGGRNQYGMASYWRRLRPHRGATDHVLMCWRQFASFGRVLCDRMLVCLAPSQFSFEFVGADEFRSAIAANRGCIVLSAHIGNWELSSSWIPKLVKEGKPAHVVMVRDDLPQVQSMVDRYMRGTELVVIDPRDGVGASLAIIAALRSGSPVCMLGDRVFGGQASTVVDFLGGRARFPLGPFQVAAIAEVPIFACFLVKTGPTSYRFEVDRAWRVRPPEQGKARKDALAGVARRWARRLELQVRRYPLQWHNFFEFWER